MQDAARAIVPIRAEFKTAVVDALQNEPDGRSAGELRRPVPHRARVRPAPPRSARRRPIRPLHRHQVNRQGTASVLFRDVDAPFSTTDFDKVVVLPGEVQHRLYSAPGYSLGVVADELLQRYSHWAIPENEMGNRCLNSWKYPPSETYLDYLIIAVMVPEIGDTGYAVARRDVLTTAGVGVATGLAGCGMISGTNPNDQPLADESINIGVLGAFESDTGMSVRRGAELAVEQINASGGIGGATLDIAAGDISEDHPDKAVPEHDRLCGEMDCDLTVGLQLGSTVLDVLPSIADHETVHLTPGVFDVRVGETVSDNYDEYKYHFRAGLPDMVGMADALGEFVGAQHDELRWESAAIYTDPLGFDPYHDRVVERVSEHLDVRMELQPAAATPTSTDQLDDIEDEGCDVLLYGGYLRGDTLVDAWAGHEPEFALGGFNIVNGTKPGLWAETDGAVESTFTVDAFTPESANTPNTVAFVTEYESTYDEHPMYSGALTYDALHLYREAVEAILDDGDSDLPDQEEIVDALEGVTFTDGVVYPEFAFTGYDSARVHEPVWESMTGSGAPVIQQWQVGEDGSGVREAIAPAQNRTATYQAPPWIRDD